MIFKNEDQVSTLDPVATCNTTIPSHESDVNIQTDWMALFWERMRGASWRSFINFMTNGNCCQIGASAKRQEQLESPQKSKLSGFLSEDIKKFRSLPDVRDPMLFTWEGFVEKLRWVGSAINEFLDQDSAEYDEIPPGSISESANIMQTDASQVDNESPSDHDDEYQHENIKDESVPMSDYCSDLRSYSLVSTYAYQLPQEETASTGSFRSSERSSINEDEKKNIQGEKIHEKRNALSSFRHKVAKRSSTIAGMGPINGIFDIKDVGIKSIPELIEIDLYKQVPDSKTEIPDVVDEINEKESDVETKKKRLRHIAITGGIGYGKTTLLRRFTRMALDNNVLVGDAEKDAPTSGFNPFSGKGSFDFIHFITVKDLPHVRCTPVQLLFRSLVGNLTEEEAKAGCEWLKSSNKKILLVIDGLDEQGWNFKAEFDQMDYNDTASAECIIANILGGHLFPDAFLLTTCNESVLQLYNENLRPDKILALNGLEEDDIVKIFKSISDASNKNAIKNIDAESMSTCSTPLYLVMNSLIASQERSVKVASGPIVILNLIRLFVYEKFSHNPNITFILKRLKQTAYMMTMSHRYRFSEDQIIDIGISLEDIRDLSIVTAQGKKSKRKGNYTEMQFSHMAIQKTLCALHVCSMSARSFCMFVTNHLALPPFSFIRKVICAIILNSSTRQKYQQIVKDFLRKMLSSDTSPRHKIEILSALSECDESTFRALDKDFSKISVSDITLAPSDLNSLSKVITNSGRIDLLDLTSCYLDDKNIDTLWSLIKTGKAKIRKLCLKENGYLEFACNSFGKLVDHCFVEEVDISDCDLDKSKVRHLQKAFKHNVELDGLILNNNPHLGKAGVEIIGELVHNCGLEKIGFGNCAITPKSLSRFQRGLKGTKFRKLDLSSNPYMEIRGLEKVGEILHECRVQELNISNCQLKDKEIRKFQIALKSAKMTELDISSETYRDATEHNIIAISRLLGHVSKEIKMKNWDISEKAFTMLQENMNSAALPDLKITFGTDGQQVVMARK
uniref:uncharacterized protein LOC120327164 isoform X3 n=1 Tax=Styela clava TaxID=7725 RepID=UPI00193A7A61|nr:uncharacterized protein LOC120327164 isoform X3 [Styela clava]